MISQLVTYSVGELDRQYLARAIGLLSLVKTQELRV